MLQTSLSESNLDICTTIAEIMTTPIANRKYFESHKFETLIFFIELG